MVVVECLLWASACVILALQSLRALPWVRQSTATHHGFEVEPIDAEVVASSS